VELKRARIRRVKYWQTALAILATLSASIVLADDFKTINGKEYKADATKKEKKLPVFELARVLVRLDHIAR